MAFFASRAIFVCTKACFQPNASSLSSATASDSSFVFSSNGRLEPNLPQKQKVFENTSTIPEVSSKHSKSLPGHLKKAFERTAIVAIASSAIASASSQTQSHGPSMTCCFWVCGKTWTWAPHCRLAMAKCLSDSFLSEQRLLPCPRGLSRPVLSQNLHICSIPHVKFPWTSPQPSPIYIFYTLPLLPFCVLHHHINLPTITTTSRAPRP